MNEIVFEPFPKIARMKRNCVITEKIDGTNAQIVFDDEGNVLYGSRKRQIRPGDDNFGFAAWADSYRDELFRVLGPGRHFGEWWGAGIQREYGQTSKRFSLFNTGRRYPGLLHSVPGLGTVPVLYSGKFTTDTVDRTMESLAFSGSHAAEGYDRPEGVVVWLPVAKQLFKVTFENDKYGKPE